MTPTQQLHARAFLDRLAALDAPESADDRLDLLQAECIETGGTWMAADKAMAADKSMPDRIVEIQLHGIAVIGWTDAEALASWTAAARRILDAQVAA